MCAVIVLFNALLLVYTAIIAPVQICLWNDDDPCSRIPTLFFDAAVDIFFLVHIHSHTHACVNKEVE